ncbi:MAG: hypothetical protein ACOC25_06035 [Alkalispirochaetaceae bacterium]
MGRKLLLFLSIISVHLLFSQHLSAQERLGELLRRNSPAPEGTEAERARLTALEAYLDEAGVPVERAPVSTGPAVHTFAQYLLANPRTIDEAPLTIVVPVNAPTPSLLMGTRIAAESVARGDPMPVLFLGGAERDAVGPAWVASRLAGLPGERHVAVLSFDTVERGMLVEGGTAGDVAPFHMLQAVRAVSSAELRFGIAGNRLQLARLGLSVPEQPVGHLLSRGVPAIQITNAQGPGPARWASALLFGDRTPVEESLMLEKILELPRLLPREIEWERNYAVLQGGPVYLLLGEGELLGIGGLLLISMLLYAVSRPHRVRRYARIMGKNDWQLPVLYGAVAVYLFFATMLIDTIAFVRSFPTLWTYAPVITFAAKLLLAITLFGLSHEALRKALFSQNSSFYSGWALTLNLLALIVLLFLNLALSFYFIFTFALTFLFSYVRLPWLKRLSFSLALLPPLFFVFTVLERGEDRIARVLISSPTEATLLISLILLPYLLMLFRLDLLRRSRPWRWFARHANVRRSITALLGIGGLVVLVFYDPFGHTVPLPVTVEESAAEAHTLTVSAPRPLSESSIRVGEEVEMAWPEGERSVSLELSGRPDPLSVELDRREFLGRTQLRYTVAATEAIRSFEAVLTGVPELTIHESDFPVIEREGELRVVVGENPPNPLLIEIVVEGSEAPDLAVTATLDRPVSPVGIDSSEAISVSASTTVRTLLEAQEE